MSNHFYGDVSNLNAPYDAVPVHGLGQADDPKYPWREFSQDTLILQQDINEGLTSVGGCLIDEDGQLGPATCGGVAHFEGAAAMPSTCLNHDPPVAPTMPPCGSGAPVPAPTPSPEEQVKTGGNGVPGWAIGLGLGVAAIAVAMMLKSKKKR